MTERQKMYEIFFKDTMDRAKSNQEAQDKMILTISVALFGIMPFILDKLQSTPCNIFFVVALLVCNTLCIIAVALSFWFCAKGNVVDIKFAEEYYIQDKQESFNKKSKWTKVGEFANRSYLVLHTFSLFFLAIMLAFYFIDKGDDMNDKNSQGEAILNGLPTQNMQRFQDGIPSAMMLKLQTEGVCTSAMIKPSQPQQTNPSQQPSLSIPNNQANTKTTQNK